VVQAWGALLVVRVWVKRRKEAQTGLKANVVAVSVTVSGDICSQVYKNLLMRYTANSDLSSVTMFSFFIIFVTAHTSEGYNTQFQKVGSMHTPCTPEIPTNRPGLTIWGPHPNIRRGPFSHTRSQDFLWACTFFSGVHCTFLPPKSWRPVLVVVTFKPTHTEHSNVKTAWQKFGSWSGGPLVAGPPSMVEPAQWLIRSAYQHDLVYWVYWSL